MKWKIVADSSCDLRKADVACEDMDFTTIPFTICVDGREFVDNESLSTHEMLEAMEKASIPGSTACPPPMAWADAFEGDAQTIALTISENLSGSYNSAFAAKLMTLSRHPNKRITVLNSRSTGPAIAMCIGALREWIREGKPYEVVSQRAAELLQGTKTVFALCSFDNLVKNGRMSKMAGFLARKLGMWGIGIGSDEGRIEIKGKARGAANVLKAIIADMEQRGFRGVEVVISHCHNAALAENLRSQIKALWADARVTVLTTRGLDSFYAERGGLIVAFC